MKYVGFCAVLAVVGASLVSGCSSGHVAQGTTTVSARGGFAEPARRLVGKGDDDYCRAEVLRWQYDESSASLKFAHSRVLLDCCGQRSLHVERVDNMYEITETDEPEAGRDRCNSVCPFDIAGSIKDVPATKVYVKLLRDVKDKQGSAELAWQGELDLSRGSGQVVIDHGSAAADVCAQPGSKSAMATPPGDSRMAATP